MARIDDLWGGYRQWRDRWSSLRVPLAALCMTDEGLLDAQGKQYQLAGSALASLADLLDIPAPYFCSRPCDMQAWLFNRELSRGLTGGKLPREVGLVVEDGLRVAEVCKAHVAMLPADAVSTVVLSRAPRRACEGTEEIERVEGWMPGHSATAFLLPSARLECQTGDAVVAGVEISRGPGGQAGMQVNSLLHRAVPGSGILVRPRAEGHRLRIRRPRCAALHTPRSFRRQVARVAEAAWRDLDALLGALKQLLCVTVGNLAEAVESVARLGHLTLCSKARCEILGALAADPFGPGDTMYHVLHACSWVGTHAAERRLSWRRCLLFACGEVLRLQLEGRPLTSSARPGPDHRRASS